MKSVKEKMYSYEVTPPPESWQMIISALNEPDEMKLKSLQKRNRAFDISLAAAAVTIIIFSLFIRLDNYKNADHHYFEFVTNDQLPEDEITVPKKYSEDSASKKSAGINSIYGAVAKTYITISGPQGQPVQVSSKVASLIVSSDDQYPPNPVWNDKVKKWKDIMKASILAPTTANFLDIVDLTHALK